MKISANGPEDVANTALQLEEGLGAQVVGQIGRTALLYRPSLKKMTAAESGGGSSGGGGGGERKSRGRPQRSSSRGSGGQGRGGKRGVKEGERIGGGRGRRT